MTSEPLFEAGVFLFHLTIIEKYFEEFLLNGFTNKNLLRCLFRIQAFSD